MNEDEDGLMPMSCIDVRKGNYCYRYFHSDIEVFIDPMCIGVVGYLLNNESLFKLAKLRFNKYTIGRKGAPIIGVPFSKALELAIQHPGKLQKSEYGDQYTTVKGKVITATTVAHTIFNSDKIHFQALQFFDSEYETFYIHAIIKPDLIHIEHIDGATMFHSKEQRLLMHKKAVIEIVQGKKKFFRLDADISIKIAAALMDSFSPIMPQTKEFLDILQDK